MDARIKSGDDIQGGAEDGGMALAFSLSSLPPAYLSTSMFQKNWTGDLIRPLTLSR